jgi:lipopolysaccharide heptosyltransferase II
MKRILIVNPFGIGDVLFTTPLVRALRENFPKSYIGYVCNKRTVPLLETNPNIDEVFVFEKDDYRFLWRQSRFRCLRQFFLFLKRIKKRNLDLCVDLSLGRIYSLVLWLLGVPKRVGFNFKNRGKFLTGKIDIEGYSQKHVVEHYLELLRFMGLEICAEKLDLFLTQEDIDWKDRFMNQHGITPRDLSIGIIPAGGASWGKEAELKHWPKERFAQLADYLAEKYNAKILILGDSSEQAICRGVRHLMRKEAIDSCGKTTLRQFACLIGACKLVITNDGGPLHVAVAMNTKSISMACG